MSNDPSYKFDYNDLVRISPKLTDPLFGGQVGVICGMRRKNGDTLYIVEIDSGNSSEISEDLLEKNPES